MRARRYRDAGLQPIEWRGVTALSQPQQVGLFDLPPLTSQPTSLYTQLQRRNGWANVTSRWQELHVEGAAPDWQRTGQPTSRGNVQRQGKTAKLQMAKLNVVKERGRIRGEQVRDAGREIVPFARTILSHGEVFRGND